MSASVTSSSTARRLARTAIQTFRSGSERPAYLSASGRVAAHARERSLDGPDDVRHGDLVRRSSQPVAAVHAALAAHQAGVLELAEDVLQELQRDVLGLRDRLALDRPLAARGELDRRPHRVVRFRRNPHGRKRIGRLHAGENQAVMRMTLARRLYDRSEEQSRLGADLPSAKRPDAQAQTPGPRSPRASGGFVFQRLTGRSSSA